MVSIGELQETLEETHKEITDSNQRMRTTAQHIHSTKNNLLSCNFVLGEFMMFYSAKERHNKLSAGLICPVKIIEAKLDLIFDIED